MKKAKTKTKAKSQTRTRTKATRPAAAASAAAKAKSKEFRPQEVIKTNGSMVLEPGLLQMKTARAIAKSLKHSADTSKRLTNTPFHSALSTLNFLISHVELQKARLEAAKKELRELYGETENHASGDQTSTPPDEYGREKHS
jgi:hypothetical protein